MLSYYTWPDRLFHRLFSLRTEDNTKKMIQRWYNNWSRFWHRNLTGFNPEIHPNLKTDQNLIQHPQLDQKPSSDQSVQIQNLKNSLKSDPEHFQVWSETQNDEKPDLRSKIIEEPALKLKKWLKNQSHHWSNHWKTFLLWIRTSQKNYSNVLCSVA